jgi:hypothetical protein
MALTLKWITIYRTNTTDKQGNRVIMTIGPTPDGKSWQGEGQFIALGQPPRRLSVSGLTSAKQAQQAAADQVKTMMAS